MLHISKNNFFKYGLIKSKKYNNGIYGFCHVALIGNGLNVIKDQIKTIKSSGLFEKTNKIFFGVNGNSPLNYSFLKEFGEVINMQQMPINIGEVPTIDFLHGFCTKIPSSKIWYIHTKGATKRSRQVTAWRKYLEYFIIENYQDCIDALDSFDVCGVEWEMENPNFKKIWGFNPHKGFSGNFWWANSNYVKNIPKSNPIRKRHSAEYRFIGEKNPKVKCFHIANCHLYRKEYKRCDYEK
jgi:hypothetical protein